MSTEALSKRRRMTRGIIGAAMAICVAAAIAIFAKLLPARHPDKQTPTVTSSQAP